MPEMVLLTGSVEANGGLSFDTSFNGSAALAGRDSNAQIANDDVFNMGWAISFLVQSCHETPAAIAELATLMPLNF